MLHRDDKYDSCVDLAPSVPSAKHYHSHTPFSSTKRWNHLARPTNNSPELTGGAATESATHN
jgi:hypothetical protein